jgi:AraC-like DNA-binding protein
MLWAAGSLRRGPVSFWSGVALERRFRVFLVERFGTIWDTRFAPPADRASDREVIVYVIVAGWMTVHDARGRVDVAPPAGRVFRTLAVERAGEAPMSFRSGGKPFRAVEVRLSEDDLGPSAPAAAFAPSPALVAACEASVARTRDDDGVVAAIREVIAGLAELGVVRPDLVDGIRERERASFERMWAVGAAMYADVAHPTLEDLAQRAGLSLRQMTRDIAEMLAEFQAPGTAFRGVTHNLRLRWAILLLSTSIPLGEVAKAAGYGSIGALGRALRDAGLPAASAIRAAVIAGIP